MPCMLNMQNSNSAVPIYTSTWELHETEWQDDFPLRDLGDEAVQTGSQLYIMNMISTKLCIFVQS